MQRFIIRVQQSEDTLKIGEKEFPLLSQNAKSLQKGSILRTSFSKDVKGDMITGDGSAGEAMVGDGVTEEVGSGVLDALF